MEHAEQWPPARQPDARHAAPPHANARVRAHARARRGPAAAHHGGVVEVLALALCAVDGSLPAARRVVVQEGGRPLVVQVHPALLPARLGHQQAVAVKRWTQEAAAATGEKERRRRRRGLVGHDGSNGGSSGGGSICTSSGGGGICTSSGNNLLRHQRGETCSDRGGGGGGSSPPVLEELQAPLFCCWIVILAGPVPLTQTLQGSNNKPGREAGGRAGGRAARNSDSDAFPSCGSAALAPSSAQPADGASQLLLHACMQKHSLPVLQATHLVACHASQVAPSLADGCWPVWAGSLKHRGCSQTACHDTSAGRPLRLARRPCNPRHCSNFTSSCPAHLVKLHEAHLRQAAPPRLLCVAGLLPQHLGRHEIEHFCLLLAGPPLLRHLDVRLNKRGGGGGGGETRVGGHAGGV